MGENGADLLGPLSATGLESSIATGRGRFKTAVGSGLNRAKTDFESN